jgi:hypothetical protein
LNKKNRFRYADRMAVRVPWWAPDLGDHREAVDIQSGGACFIAMYRGDNKNDCIYIKAGCVSFEALHSVVSVSKPPLFSHLLLLNLNPNLLVSSILTLHPEKWIPLLPSAFPTSFLRWIDSSYALIRMSVK